MWLKYTVAWQGRLGQSNADGSEPTREDCWSRVGKNGHFKGTVGSERQQRERERRRKAGKAREAKGKAQNARMVPPSRMVLAITVKRSVTLHVNVRRRKKQAMQVPVVEVV